MHASKFRNTILRNLDADAIARLALRPIHFEVRHEIEFPGNPVAHLFFVEEGMASQTTTFDDGSQVEVGMFGYEGVIGVSALMGTKRSLNRIYTQIEGSGYSASLTAAKKEFLRGDRFQTLALSYVQAQLVQAMQSAGCNAKHNVEQRLARWLLMCADRVHRDHFQMPHEFMADMLGSSRPTVSLAAGALKEEGLIEYARGSIRILNSAALEHRSCECYHIIKDHLDNYAEFDSGKGADAPEAAGRITA